MLLLDMLYFLFLSLDESGAGTLLAEIILVLRRMLPVLLLIQVFQDPTEIVRLFKQIFETNKISSSDTEQPTKRNQSNHHKHETHLVALKNNNISTLTHLAVDLAGVGGQ